MATQNGSPTISGLSNITVVNIPVVPIQESVLASPPILVDNHINNQLREFQSSHNIFSSVSAANVGKVNFIPLQHQSEQISSSINNCISIPDSESFVGLPPHPPVCDDNFHDVLSNFQHNFDAVSDTESSNPSLLKIPVINIGSNSSIVHSNVDVSALNSSVSITGQYQVDTPRLRESEVGSIHSCSARRSESASYAISFDDSSTAESFVASEAHATADVSSSSCRKLRPIQPLHRFAGVNKTVPLPCESERLFYNRLNNSSQDGISIVKCELDSLDSFMENAVITVDDIYDKCDETVHSHHSMHGNGNEFKNPDVASESGTDTGLFLPRELRVNHDGYDSESKENSTFTYNLVNDVICILCGNDDSLLDLTKNDIFPDKTGSKVLNLICSVLLLNESTDLCVQSGVMCVHCLKLVRAVDNLKKSLSLKENLIKSMYSETVKKVRGLLRNRAKLRLNSDHIANFSLPSFANDGSSDAVDSKNAKNDANCKISRLKRKAYRCQVCQEKFPSLSHLEQHLQRCKNETESQNVSKRGISLSSSRTSEGREVKQQKKARLRKRFSCEECFKSFPDRRRLVAHSTAHERGFECRVCGRYLTTRVRLATHLFKFHGIGEEKRKVVNCDQCDKAFQTKQGLAYHKNVSHKTGSKYACPHCDKVFYYHVLYRSHMLFAHGEKKVVCKQCGDRFFTVSKLNTHINAKHINAKTWQCTDCSVQFTTGTAYRQHNLVKHRGAMIACDYCSAKYKTKSSLFTHLREHNVYACKVCKELLCSAEQHASHMLSVHNQVVSKLPKRKVPSAALDRRLVRPKTISDSHLKVSRQVVETSSDLTRIDLNEILLNNSYNNSSALHMFNSGNQEKMNNSYVPCSGDKIRSFAFLDSTNELGVPAQSSAIALDNNVSFINVEILDNLPSNDRDNLPANDPENSIPLLDTLDHVENMSANLNNIEGFNHVMNSNLPSELASSVESFPQVSGPSIVVEELVKQAVGGMDANVPDFDSSIGHLDDANLTSTVENLESDLRPMSTRLENDVHQMEVATLQSPVVDMEPSVRELCTVDMEAPVDQLGADACIEVPVERLSPSDIAHSVDLVNSTDEIQIPDNDMHSSSPKAIQSSNIWLKENAWAMLKGTSGDENLASLQNLSNPTMEDLDIGVMDGDIVADNVIGSDEAAHLDMDVSDKENVGSLEALDVDMTN